MSRDITEVDGVRLTSFLGRLTDNPSADRTHYQISVDGHYVQVSIAQAWTLLDILRTELSRRLAAELAKP